VCAPSASRRVTRSPLSQQCRAGLEQRSDAASAGLSAVARHTGDAVELGFTASHAFAGAGSRQGRPGTGFAASTQVPNVRQDRTDTGGLGSSPLRRPQTGAWGLRTIPGDSRRRGSDVQRPVERCSAGNRRAYQRWRSSWRSWRCTVRRTTPPGACPSSPTAFSPAGIALSRRSGGHADLPGVPARRRANARSMPSRRSGSHSALMIRSWSTSAVDWRTRGRGCCPAQGGSSRASIFRLPDLGKTDRRAPSAQIWDYSSRISLW
jgi:hypothetical protein